MMGTVSIGDSERSYLKSAVRAVVGCSINTGDMIIEEKIAFRRCLSEAALTPKQLFALLPAVASVFLEKDQPIHEEHLKKPVVIIAVVCRLKSTRLPKKALLPINGVASVERCLLNCLAVNGVNSVVLATSDLDEDSELEKFTLNGKVQVIRGDAEDVAERLLKAARLKSADILLRVTGDCPVVSPEILEYLMTEHMKSDADLTIQTDNHAIGTSADVYNIKAIEKLKALFECLGYTEYLSAYFRNNPQVFKVNYIELPKEWRHPEWRLTLDEALDLEMFDTLFKRLNIGKEPLYFTRLAEFLSAHPEVAEINSKVHLKWKDDAVLRDQILKGTVLNRRA